MKGQIDLNDDNRRREECYFEQEGCWIAEWSNTPDDEAVPIARARLEPGVTTSWHKLDGITERYVILQGRGRAEIGEATRNVEPSDVIVIPPDTPQRITNSGREDLVFLAICTPRFTKARTNRGI